MFPIIQHCNSTGGGEFAINNILILLFKLWMNNFQNIPLNVLLDFISDLSVLIKTTTFQKLVLFPSSGDRVGEQNPPLLSRLVEQVSTLDQCLWMFSDVNIIRNKFRFYKSGVWLSMYQLHVYAVFEVLEETSVLLTSICIFWAYINLVSEALYCSLTLSALFNSTISDTDFSANTEFGLSKRQVIRRMFLLDDVGLLGFDAM